MNAVDDPSTYMWTVIGAVVSGSRAQPVAVTLVLVVVTLSMNPIGETPVGEPNQSKKKFQKLRLPYAEQESPVP